MCDGCCLGQCHSSCTSKLRMDRFGRSGPEVIKLSSCSTQLSIIFFPTIIGILTFMSEKNSIPGLSEPKKKPNCLIFLYL